MADVMQMRLYVILCFISGSVAEVEVKNETDLELAQTESNRRLEIIKRIKKINEDGSYTIGYEADDGSFKLESRDVLGHIKGTYGFVDEEGKIKRVSYSSDSSEVPSKPEEPVSSVVQRIPNKKQTDGYIFTSTQSTPVVTSTSVQDTKKDDEIQTTQIPNNSLIKSKYPTYSTPHSRISSQDRFSSASTILNKHNNIEKQVLKSKDVTTTPTKQPSFTALYNVSNDKPINEGAESQIRMQLSPDGKQNYNVQEHIFRLQQSLGHDVTDVYSSSMTTGTPRPLFTTTYRPTYLSTSHRPQHTHTFSTTPYPPDARKVYEEYSGNEPEISVLQVNEKLLSGPTQSSTNPLVVQTRNNKAQNQVSPVKSNHRRGTVLEPLHGFQGRIPMQQVTDVYQKPYHNAYSSELAQKPKIVEALQQEALVRRLHPEPPRPMLVRVDENGYVRHVQKPVPAPFMPNYVQNHLDDPIDNINPPVSTEDFRRLLQQLIMRQRTLENISELTKQAEVYRQPVPIFPTRTNPYILERNYPSGSKIFLSQKLPQESKQEFVQVQHQNFVPSKNYPQSTYEENYYDPEIYKPNRRVARVYQSNDDYLPPDIREMLLLRMLQLAVNPALPVPFEDVKFAAGSSATRTPHRNVEILGEEESEEESNVASRGARLSG